MLEVNPTMTSLSLEACPGGSVHLDELKTEELTSKLLRTAFLCILKRVRQRLCTLWGPSTLRLAPLFGLGTRRRERRALLL